jgi:hypothetical protein
VLSQQGAINGADMEAASKGVFRGSHQNSRLSVRGAAVDDTANSFT